AQQIVTAATRRDVDVVALASEAGEHCVVVMFIRGGRNLGSTQFFPRAPLGETAELISAFLTQYYLSHEVPPEILVNVAVPELEALVQLLSERAQRQVRVRRAARGLALRWCEMTYNNAIQALRMKVANRAGIEINLAELGQLMQMPEPPQRIEC